MFLFEGMVGGKGWWIVWEDVKGMWSVRGVYIMSGGVEGWFMK